MYSWVIMAVEISAKSVHGCGTGQLYSVHVYTMHCAIQFYNINFKPCYDQLPLKKCHSSKRASLQ